MEVLEKALHGLICSQENNSLIFEKSLKLETLHLIYKRETYLYGRYSEFRLSGLNEQKWKYFWCWGQWGIDKNNILYDKSNFDAKAIGNLDVTCLFFREWMLDFLEWDKLTPLPH
jgi:hypothetical protein